MSEICNMFNFSNYVISKKKGVDLQPVEEKYCETNEKFEFHFLEDVDDNKIDIYNEPYLESYRKYSNEFEGEIVFEIILSEKSFKYSVYPIEYHSIWDNYKRQQEANWIVEEIDLSKDKYDWDNKLSDSDRLFIMHILAFFSAFDGIVDENINTNFIEMIKIKESICAYGKQFDMENVHGEMYSMMLSTFIDNEELKNKLINSIKTIECVKKKAIWCKKWIDSDKTFAHKIIVFAIVEGVFFSGSFASIFWLKNRPGSILSGFLESNKFIARDESLHVELATLHYNLCNNRLKQSVVYEIMEEAVLIEDEFINSGLPCKLLGINSDLMSQYIRYVSDRLLVQLGYEKKYFTTNPFEFMEKIDVISKTNFFEKRNDAYKDAKINNSKKYTILPLF